MVSSPLNVFGSQGLLSEKSHHAILKRLAGFGGETEFEPKGAGSVNQDTQSRVFAPPILGELGRRLQIKIHYIIMLFTY
jgi:hypothetical protein